MLKFAHEAAQLGSSKRPNMAASCWTEKARWYEAAHAARPRQRAKLACRPGDGRQHPPVFANVLGTGAPSAHEKSAAPRSGRVKGMVDGPEAAAAGWQTSDTKCGRAQVRRRAGRLVRRAAPPSEPCAQSAGHPADFAEGRILHQLPPRAAGAGSVRVSGSAARVT